MARHFSPIMTWMASGVIWVSLVKPDHGKASPWQRSLCYMEDWILRIRSPAKLLAHSSSKYRNGRTCERWRNGALTAPRWKSFWWTRMGGSMVMSKWVPTQVHIFFLTIETRKTDVTPWDKLKEIQPPLRALLQSRQQDWPRQGRALVPGCGRVGIPFTRLSVPVCIFMIYQGYDAIFIASILGLDTLGLDISTTAIQSAHRYYFFQSKEVNNFHGRKQFTYVLAWSFPRESNFPRGGFFFALRIRGRKIWLGLRLHVSWDSCRLRQNMLYEEFFKFFRGNPSIKATGVGTPNEFTCKIRWILNHTHLSYKTFHRRRSPILHSTGALCWDFGRELGEGNWYDTGGKLRNPCRTWAFGSLEKALTVPRTELRRAVRMEIVRSNCLWHLMPLY